MQINSILLDRIIVKFMCNFRNNREIMSHIDLIINDHPMYYEVQENV